MIKKNKPSKMDFLYKFYKEINENGETFYVFDEEEYFAWRQQSKHLSPKEESVEHQIADETKRHNQDEPFIERLRSIISDYIDFRFANKDTEMSQFSLNSLSAAICDHHEQVDEEMLRIIKSDFEKFSIFFNSQGSLKHQADAINQGKTDKLLSSTGLKLYTTRDIASKLNCGVENIRKDVRNHKLQPCSRQGRIQLFNEEEVNRYIKAKRK